MSTSQVVRGAPGTQWITQAPSAASTAAVFRPAVYTNAPDGTPTNVFYTEGEMLSTPVEDSLNDIIDKVGGGTSALLSQNVNGDVITNLEGFMAIEPVAPGFASPKPTMVAVPLDEAIAPPVVEFTPPPAPAVQPVAEKVDTAVAAASQATQSIKTEVADKVADASDAVKSFTTGFGEAVSDAVTGISEKVSVTVTDVSDAVSEATSNITESITSAVETVQTEVPKVALPAAAPVEKVVEKVQQVVESAAASVPAPPPPPAAVEKVVEKVVETAQGVAAKVPEVVEKVAPPPPTDVMDRLQAASDTFGKPAVSEYYNRISSSDYLYRSSNSGDRYLQALKERASNVSVEVTNIPAAASEAFRDASEAAGRALSSAQNAAGGIVNNFDDFLAGSVRGVSNVLGDTVGEGVAEVAGSFSGATRAVTALAGEVVGSVDSVVGVARRAVGSNLDGVVSTVAGTAMGVANEVNRYVYITQAQVYQALPPEGQAVANQVGKVVDMGLQVVETYPVPTATIIAGVAIPWAYNNYQARYGGYAGELSARQVSELLGEEEGQVLLLDIRPDPVREKDGLPFLRLAARFRAISLPLSVGSMYLPSARSTGTIRGMKDMNKLALETYAVLVAGLKQVPSPLTKVVVMDSQDSDLSRTVARALRQEGLYNSFVMKDGYKGWVDSGLAINDRDTEYDTSVAAIVGDNIEVVKEQASDLAEKLKDPRVGIPVAAGVVGAGFAIYYYEISLQVVALVGMTATIYNQLRKYDTPQEALIETLNSSKALATTVIKALTPKPKPLVINGQEVPEGAVLPKLPMPEAATRAREVLARAAAEEASAKAAEERNAREKAQAERAAKNKTFKKLELTEEEAARRKEAEEAAKRELEAVLQRNLGDEETRRARAEQDNAMAAATRFQQELEEAARKSEQSRRSASMDDGDDAKSAQEAQEAARKAQLEAIERVRAEAEALTKAKQEAAAKLQEEDKPSANKRSSRTGRTPTARGSKGAVDDGITSMADVVMEPPSAKPKRKSPGSKTTATASDGATAEPPAAKPKRRSSRSVKGSPMVPSVAPVLDTLAESAAAAASPEPAVPRAEAEQAQAFSWSPLATFDTQPPAVATTPAVEDTFRVPEPAAPAADEPRGWSPVALDSFSSYTQQAQAFSPKPEPVQDTDPWARYSTASNQASPQPEQQPEQAVAWNPIVSSFSSPEPDTAQQVPLPDPNSSYSGFSSTSYTGYNDSDASTSAPGKKQRSWDDIFGDSGKVSPVGQAYKDTDWNNSSSSRNTGGFNYGGFDSPEPSKPDTTSPSNNNLNSTSYGGYGSYGTSWVGEQAAVTEERSPSPVTTNYSYGTDPLDEAQQAPKQEEPAETTEVWNPILSMDFSKYERPAKGNASPGPSVRVSRAARKTSNTVSPPADVGSDRTSTRRSATGGY